jgi:hypothetical protein
MLTDSHSGSRLGKQINEALDHMLALQELVLGICSSIPVDAWSSMADGPMTRMTTLQRLTLDCCDMDMCDFSKLLLNMTSLKRLFLSEIRLHKGSQGDLANVFLSLANGLCELEVFTLEFMSMDREMLIFPSSLRQPGILALGSEGEIEDDFGWIMVAVHPWIHWKGKDNIKWALREMAAYVQSL